MEQQSSGKVIQSVQRAIDIIACFDSLQTELSLTQISNQLNLNKSTVHGIISTLYKNNYISQSPSGRYRLGPFFYREFENLGFSVRSLLKEKTLLGMNAIADKYNVSCAVFILEMGELILVNRIQPIGEAYTVTAFSTYIQPLYCSASGKILLSEMDEKQLSSYLQVTPLTPRTENTISSKEELLEKIEETRAQGYGEENEELGKGIYSVSVPIYDSNHKLFATLSASGLVFQVKQNQMNIINDLKEIASEVSAKIFRGK